jgi:hypothetical protein
MGGAGRARPMGGQVSLPKRGVRQDYDDQRRNVRPECPLCAVHRPAPRRARQGETDTAGFRGPGPLLEPPWHLLTHLHTVYLACSECLPTRLNPLAERTCFSQVPDQFVRLCKSVDGPKITALRTAGVGQRGLFGGVIRETRRNSDTAPSVVATAPAAPVATVGGVRCGPCGSSPSPRLLGSDAAIHGRY